MAIFKINLETLERYLVDIRLVDNSCLNISILYKLTIQQNILNSRLVQCKDEGQSTEGKTVAAGMCSS